MQCESDGFEGNYDKDRRRKKLKRDKDRRRGEKNFEKSRRPRRVFIDKDEELDFDWN